MIGTRFHKAMPHSVRPEVKHVPATVVVGQHRHCVSPGFTEVNGIRFHPDSIAIGKFGEPVLTPGWSEVATVAGRNRKRPLPR
jgi:hypothetical protein